jgi:hypothetical protein
VTSNRKRARRLATWRAYQRRIDNLAPQAPTTAAYTDGCLFVIKTNPGFFRAEGWTRRSMLRTDLRHGA